MKSVIELVRVSTEGQASEDRAGLPAQREINRRIHVEVGYIGKILKNETTEIDIDNVFRRILLHAKKKYAAINMVEVDGKFTEKLEVKGLDMRRREYCQLSKETSS